MKTQTPRDVALQLASLITLYVSLTAFLVVAFGWIDLTFKDIVDSWEYTSIQSSVRFSFALLVVFFPAYLYLTRKTNQIMRSEDRSYALLTKWLVYFSLVVAGLVFLGDMVAILYAFLEGEITIRFLLKTSILALVVAFAGMYYLKDAKEYWQTHERQSLYCAAGAIGLVLLMLGMAYTVLDTPQTVREQRIDDGQVTDLQELQYAIEEYYRVQQTLPESLNEASTITAPEGRNAYTYATIDATTYELCATFREPSTKNTSYARPVFDQYSWEHGVGEECFVRSVEMLKSGVY